MENDITQYEVTYMLFSCSHHNGWIDWLKHVLTSTVEPYNIAEYQGFNLNYILWPVCRTLLFILHILDFDNEKKKILDGMDVI